MLPYSLIFLEDKYVAVNGLVALLFYFAFCAIVRLDRLYIKEIEAVEVVGFYSCNEQSEKVKLLIRVASFSAGFFNRTGRTEH